MTLKAPPLAAAARAEPRLFAFTRRSRLELHARESVAYLRFLASEQSALARRIRAEIAGANVRWRYSVVLDGVAVVAPSGEVARLASLPGVDRVYPSVTYHALLDRSVPLIGAPALWGPNLATAGTGMKIGIIDDGVDQRHRFFSPAGFAPPAGFPKGNTKFTTAKVIVARAFPPPTPRYSRASLPFDAGHSEHGTHVAGIAAGDYNTATSSGRRVSGVAPRAYIGNYKVLTIPTALGLNGNAPEIAAGIEAAVRDGMDVINLSLGEAEIDPSRDLVVRAIDAAADAGVVPVVAAGNDFTDLGFGTIGSPGTAPKAITVASTTKADTISDFSSAGPTPIDFLLKPDVSAPGDNIYSSVPGGWDQLSGTSMASPHVAGGAALLRERHPSWTVAQVKSALTLTARPVSGREHEVPATREGGGLINLPAADAPLLLAQPSSLSFGLLRRATRRALTVALEDAGGGAGLWSLAVALRARHAGLAVSAPASVTVPGAFTVSATAGRRAAQADATGFLVLSRGTTRRRIPFWLRVTEPALRREPHVLLHRPGTYRGDTARKRALVTAYRYPDNPSSLEVARFLPGPEQVFRVVVRRPVANFGVIVISEARGVDVEPRVVRAGDENELTGYAGLPFVLNPYLPDFERPEPIAAAVRPAPGGYDIVFDTPSRHEAGPFHFRLWIDDVRPPSIGLLSRSVARGSTLRLRIRDGGSGVDRSSVGVRVDGALRRVRWGRGGLATVSTRGLARGRHRLLVIASDYQEKKNMENVPRILPNTRLLRTAFRVR